MGLCTTDRRVAPVSDQELRMHHLRVSLTTFALSSLLAVACAHNAPTGPGTDAGPRTDAATSTDQTDAATPIGVDAFAAAEGDAPLACRVLAEECAGDPECCSGRCASGTCAEPLGECTPTSAACDGDEACCSGHCANAICTQPLGTCRTLGDVCLTNEACCSGRCDGGACTLAGISACVAIGGTCSSDASCCSEAAGIVRSPRPRTRVRPSRCGGACARAGRGRSGARRCPRSPCRRRRSRASAWRCHRP